jgi:hypothetical protein
MLAAMSGLTVIVLIAVIGIVAITVSSSSSTTAQSGLAPTLDESSQTAADELRRIREAESEVERIGQETQDAIIKRAMSRALWRQQGSGK